MIEPPGRGRFRVLGPLEVWTGRDWSGVSAPKWRALLGLLLLQAGQPVATGQLVDGLWPEGPPARAGNLVSVYVHRLRHLLGDERGTVLVTRAPGYQVVLDPGDLDADRFSRLVADGRNALAAGDPAPAADLLAGALGLWRGRALADVPPSPLVAAEAERLEEGRLAALILRIQADLACGRAAEVTPELRRLLADHPLREELWALLMRGLHLAGRQAEALETFARAREVIAGELGVDPGPELRKLHEDILRGDAAGAAASREGATPAPPGDAAAPGARRAAPPPAHVTPSPGEMARPGGAPVRPAAAAARAPGGPAVGTPRPAGAMRWVAPAQLPADIPDFTGRGAGVGELRRLLSGAEGQASPGAVPVVLVVGSGGLGKTALAVHAAHLLAAAYPHGQLYASLLGATQPAAPGDVLARFLRALGMDPAHIPADTDERAAQYRTLLAGRRVLIVLDDARDAAQVSPLLPGSASCAVVITARGRLPELVGSKVIDLDVLPPAEARTLLGRVAGEERVSAERAAAEDVLAACAGLPLAIRIAGARLAARGGWQVRHLATRLSDERRRLDELRAGNLAVRASFEVSFASLSGSARPGGVDPAHAFRLLGVWTGPTIALPAAAALAGRPEPDVADALEVLVDGHLLDSPAPDRYRFHDLLRVYAADRAQADETEQDRQAAITRLLTWYLHTTEAAARVISPNRIQVPLEPLPAGVSVAGFASLQDALAWCEAERAGLLAAVRLAAVWGLDVIAWKLPAAAMSFLYRRSYWTDWVNTHQAGLDRARVSGDRLGEAWMLNNLGMAFGQQRRPEAVGYFEQALALHRDLGDRRGETRAANNVAKAYFDLRRFPEALDASHRALVIQRQARNRYGEGLALGLLGGICHEMGRQEAAVDYVRQSLAIFRELGDKQAEADSLSDLGGTYLDMDRTSDAVDCLLESLTIWQATGNRYGQAATLRRLGHAQRRVGDGEQGLESLTEALRLFTDLGDEAQANEIREELTALASQAS